MRIGGLQKFSLLDYPGNVAAIVFTQGCVYRCHYCHNPELVLPELFGPTMDEEEVFSFLTTRQGKLDGIVVTGGEPLLQSDLADFLQKVKDLGFLVKLDTTGFSPTKLKALIDDKLVDYVAMDIKAPLEKYSMVVGKTEAFIEGIRESIALLIGSTLAYEFRTTVATELLSLDDILSIGETITGAKRYALQNFVSSKTVDPEFLHATPFPEWAMVELQGKLEREFVGECVLR